MRIGVDVDGVLNNVGQFEIDYGSKFYIENTNRHLDNPQGYDSVEMFCGDKKEDNEFWGKAIYEFVKYPARDFAGEVLFKLKNLGHEIYIVTARTSDLSYCDISPEKMKKIVENWLKKWKIPYNKIVWTGKDKVSACLENKIDVMIDDCPRNILDISKHIPVICFDARYNAKCEGENIIRCFSWFDVYDKIKFMKSKQVLN